MAFLPSIFYYKISISGVKGTTENTGRIIIEKLIHNEHDYFLDITSIEEEKPKKLFWTDWSAEGYTLKGFKEFQATLLEALKQGFEFYASNGIEFELWDSSYIQSLSYDDFIAHAKAIYPITLEDVLKSKTIPHQKLERDSLFLLDDFGAKQFYLRRILKNRSIDLNTLANMTFFKRMAVISYLRDSNPGVDIILINNNSGEAHNILNKLKAIYPNLETKGVYRNYIKFRSYRDLINYNESNSMGKRNLTDTDVYINFPIIPIKEIPRCFQIAPNLKILELRSASVDIEKIPENTCTELILNCGTEKTDGKRINALLEKFPKLRKFTLGGEQLDLQEFELFNNAVIQDFSLNMVSYTSHLPTIATDKLICLTTNNCQIQDDRLIKNIIELKSNMIEYLFYLKSFYPSLRVLDFSEVDENAYRFDTTFYETDIQKLLKRVPNLEYLGVPIKGGLAFIKSIPFLPKLKYLSCRLNDIPVDDLDNLTNIFANLEYFSGICSSDQGAALAKMFGKDNQLRELVLSTHNIDFFQNAVLPNLEYLTFDIPDIFYDYHEDSSSDSSSEEIALTINASVLFEFLKKLPNLKILNLEKIEELYFQTKIELNKFNEYLKQQGILYLHNQETISIRDITIPEPSHIKPSKKNEDRIIQPRFNPAELELLAPIPQETRFVYKGSYFKDDHNLFIQQLSQYLTINQKHLAYLPELEEGICSTLAHWFLLENEVVWNTRIERIKKWNGQKHTLTELLIEDFELLFSLLIKYQYEFKSVRYFLGTDLIPILLKNKDQIGTKGVIVHNLWHAISVKYIGQYMWHIYDANYLGGYQIIRSNMLHDQITQSLGNLLYIENTNSLKLTNFIPQIHDANNFFKLGGWIVLAWETTSTLQNLVLADYDRQLKNTNYHDGLFVRTTYGIPAWAICLKYPKVALILLQFLDIYLKIDPEKNNKRFETSMEAMAPFERLTYIEALLTLTEQKPEFDSLKKAILTLVHSASNKKHFLTELATWNKQKSLTGNLKEYLHQVVMPKTRIKNQLIEFNDQESLDTVREELIVLAQPSIPVLFIDSDRKLLSSAPYIKKIGNKGHFVQGPGGLFYDFVQKNSHAQRAILIIDYSQMKPEKIAQLNSLLQEGIVDGLVLPPSFNIIGLSNKNSPYYYEGEDFYSRFEQVAECPIPSEELKKYRKKIEVERTTPSANGYPIQLCNSTAWKDILLGHWTFDKDQLIFKKGLLQKALDQKLKSEPIIIENGLWQDYNFSQWMRDLILNGQIVYEGETIQLPPNIKIIRREGYDWNNLVSCFNPEKTLPKKEPLLTLNQALFPSFFAQYECVPKQSTIYLGQGLLQKYQNEVLSFELTHAITEDQWAQLLIEAKLWNVTLDCHVPFGVAIPKALEDKVHGQIPHMVGALEPNSLSHTEVIQSNNIPETLKIIADNKQKMWVIDISELQASEFLEGIDGQFITNPPSFTFNKKASALLNWLEEDKTIICTGSFARKWAQLIAPILKNRLNTHNPKGRLILIGESMNDFNYTHKWEHKTKAREYFPEKPLSLISLKPFNFNTSRKDADTFIRNRELQIGQSLADSPYVLVLGLTGVGKTKTIRNLAKNNPNITLYEGMTRLEDWLLDKEENTEKILFIDEANMANMDFTGFEGLYQYPPQYYYKGRLYELSKKHKVIFAGNPLSYGGNRKQPEFFKRHGVTIEFAPLSLAVIYEDVLKPLDLKPQDINSILNIYSFLCSCSKTEVLISPREVLMMGLLLKSCKDFDLFDFGTMYVPKENSLEYEQRFPTPIRLQNLKPLPLKNGFLVTGSRIPLFNQILSLLQVRELRQHSKNELEQYGGINGLVIEGLSGIGKSELVIQILLELGFQEVHRHSKELPKKPFYRMSKGLDIDILHKAWNEGAVVIADEINCSPSEELVLNDLLMGFYHGKHPDKPGFMLIGTQNPPSMRGRKALSPALMHRMLHLPLAPYPREEMHQILLHKGLSERQSHELLDAYTEQSLKAALKNLKPPPNFRNVERIADNIIKMQSLMKDHKSSTLSLLSMFQNTQTEVGDLDTQKFEKKH